MERDADVIITQQQPAGRPGGCRVSIGRGASGWGLVPRDQVLEAYEPCKGVLVALPLCP